MAVHGQWLTFSTLQKEQRSPGNIQSSNSIETLFDSSKFHDPEKIASGVKLKSNNVTKKLSTTLSYIQGESGHNISSDEKPRIISLDKKFSSQRYEAVPTLSMIFKTYTRNDLQLTVICNTMQQARLAESVLTDLYGPSKVSIFIPSLLNRYPSIKEKKEALSKSRKVLITDYRAFRGCEIEHCVLFLDQNERIAKNMYVEMLTRTINKLDLLILPSNGKTSFSSVLKTWQEKGLVSSSKVKTVSRKNNVIEVAVCDENGSNVKTFEANQDEMNTFQEMQSLEDNQNSFKYLKGFTLEKKPNKSKWNGEIYYEMMMLDGRTLSFEDVFNIIQKGDFKQLDILIEEEPHLLNSLRNKKPRQNQTLLMRLLEEEMTTVLENTLERYILYEQDFIVVDINDNNSLHFVAKSHNLDVHSILPTLKAICERSNSKELTRKQNAFGYTPLHEAGAAVNIRITNKIHRMQYLYDNGGDTATTTINGNRILHLFNQVDKTVNLLLLGEKESDKSKITKHLTISNGGFEGALYEYGTNDYLVNSMKVALNFMRENNLFKFTADATKIAAKTFFSLVEGDEFILTLKSPVLLSTMKELWRDEAVQHNFLHAKTCESGVSSIQITKRGMNHNILEVGCAPSEHNCDSIFCINKITAIIYCLNKNTCTAILDSEGKEEKASQESFELMYSICNDYWLSEIPIIIVLNMPEKFTQKTFKSDLFKSKFQSLAMQKDKRQREIYTAFNTSGNEIARAIFGLVGQIIITGSLKKKGY